MTRDQGGAGRTWSLRADSEAEGAKVELIRHHGPGGSPPHKAELVVETPEAELEEASSKS